MLVLHCNEIIPTSSKLHNIIIYPLLSVTRSLHGSRSSSHLSLVEIGVENEGESKEDTEGMCNMCILTTLYVWRSTTAYGAIVRSLVVC